MNINEDDKLQNKLKLYRIGVVMLLVAIFLLAEGYFGALNKYNELSKQMESTQEEYETNSYNAGFSDGYNEGYDKGCSIYLNQGMRIEDYLPSK